MTVYFGIPVTIIEAYRIFGINIENTIEEILKKYNLTREIYIDGYLVDVLNKYLKESCKIKIYSTDKGMYVIGYEIKEVSNVSDTFINMDNFIILLLQLKKLFIEETIRLNADLSKVNLAYMEGNDNDIVSNPIPYIISW